MRQFDDYAFPWWGLMFALLVATLGLALVNVLGGDDAPSAKTRPRLQY